MLWSELSVLEIVIAYGSEPVSVLIGGAIAGSNDHPKISPRT